MANVKPREEMSQQPADERIRNFYEVALGYSEEQAVYEAKRCLSCKKKPCMAGCPVLVDIPEFVGLSQAHEQPSGGVRARLPSGGAV